MKRCAVLLPLVLAACGRQSTPAPPRVDTPVELPKVASTIVVPVSARLGDLQRGLEKAIPHDLWSIDQLQPNCVPAQRVKIFGKRLKVTPDLSCRIVGRVTRGPIALSGSGDRLRITLPVKAVVSARDVGHFVKQETATGAATVFANVRLSVRRDWTPTGTVDIQYGWTTPPGVTLLGQRITFVDKADAKLASVVAQLERDLPKQLAQLDARAKVAEAWRQGFTSLQLNRENPPVWLRIVPQQVSFSGYRIQGDTLALTAAARALTQTFVGKRPPDPTPAPLPLLSHDVGKPALAFSVPVIADYAQLEPVLARALVKLSRKGITLPRLGAVDAEFGKVTIYATTGNRLAVGAEVKAKLKSGLLGGVKGTIWLTGVPYNAPDSEVVEIRDLGATGETNNSAVNVILLLAQNPAVLDTVRTALTQDFAKDYAKVLTSARAAIAEKRQGDFVLAATIDRVTHGRVVPTGQGLYLPVEARGNASIAYRPLRKGKP